MRDASRRTLSFESPWICRRNCVADDRACTRVPLQNLHGKEGVDGSSPSEGSAKAPLTRGFLFRSVCRFPRLQWVWSPLWSLQVENGVQTGGLAPVQRACRSPSP